MESQIIIDARAQQHTNITGVGIYTRNLIYHLAQSHINKNITIFQNSFSGYTHTFENTNQKSSNIPSKILNASIFVQKKPTIQSLCALPDNTPIFYPNINFIPSTHAPYILTVHDLSFEHYPHWYSRKMRIWHKIIQPKHIIKNADHIISVSHHTAQDVQKTYNISPDKITTIYPGISMSTCIKNQDAQYICTLSSTDTRKNIKAVIYAFHKISQKPQHKNLTLYIIGPQGNDHKKINNLIKSLNINDKVVFTGYVTEKEKQQYLADAQAFVYPSLFEGFGFPPLEAMLQKTPVITSHSSSLSELFADYAILVNPYNHSELADAISIALQNTSHIKSTTEKAYHYARTFTWDRTINTMTKLLKQYL